MHCQSLYLYLIRLANKLLKKNNGFKLMESLGKNLRISQKIIGKMEGTISSSLIILHMKS